MTQKTIALLQKLWGRIQLRPIFYPIILLALLLGAIFIYLGSVGLLLKLLAKRPLLYFGVYLAFIIALLFSHYVYSKTKTKSISNATFNHFLRDVSTTIKTVIVLFLSFFLTAYTATKIISVYFNKYDSQYHMSGSGNIFNLYPPGPYSLPSKELKNEITKEETAKKEITPAETLVEKQIPKWADNIKLKEKVTITDGSSRRDIVLSIPRLYLSQEYPSSQGHSYTQSINLSSGSPAVITLRKDEQPMWFGVGNLGITNVGNPTLFLNFDGTFDIRAKERESLGWMTMDPNKQFNTKINMVIQPGSGVKLYSLFVKFPKAGEYHGRYTIASDNDIPIEGTFIINVVNE